jgi:hypothetical protein
MKVLFTGIGGFGSWTMRAEQMAATRPDWKAVPHATRKDAEGMDAVVIVKSIRDENLAELKAWGGPVVYDPLDFWRQRRNPWKRWARKNRLKDIADARAMAAAHFARIDPDLILCPTRAMVEDITPLGWKVGLLYHHYDPRIGDMAPPAGKRRRVVYHGRPEHLGWWLVAVYLSCFVHGVKFVTSNGPQPPPGHVLLGVRRAYPWISRRWKSNIKAAVALRLGLPFVAWPEAGYRETHPSAFWFTNVFEMHRAIGKALAADPAAPDDRFSVEACATELENILRDFIANRANQSATDKNTLPID